MRLTLCSTTLDKKKKKKKKTIPEIRGEKNALPHVISCSISEGQKLWMTLPCADRSWSSMISQDRSVLLAANLGDGSFVCVCVQGSTQRVNGIHSSLYFTRKQVGDAQKREKPEMRSSCRNSLALHWSAWPRLRVCKCPPPQIPVSCRHFNE